MFLFPHKKGNKASTHLFWALLQLYAFVYSSIDHCFILSYHLGIITYSSIKSSLIATIKVLTPVYIFTNIYCHTDSALIPSIIARPYRCHHNHISVAASISTAWKILLATLQLVPVQHRRLHHYGPTSQRCR